jgi:predicted transcriptional regulator
MDIVWKRGQATAEVITRDLPGDLGNASVRTLLKRIEAKGFLHHRTEGRSFVYIASVGQSDAGRSAVSRVAARFYRGSIEQLLLGLVEGKIIGREQLERLSQEVADAEARGRGNRKLRR